MNVHIDPRLNEKVPSQGMTRSGIAYLTKGNGPPLILFHGSMGSWRHWVRNIPALSSIRTVIALDLPGYGQSTAVEPGISADAYIDLVFSAVIDICGGTETIDLAGFSFGGQIALGCAVRLGSRTRRLALLTPSGFTAPKGRTIEMPRRRDFDQSESRQREYHRRVLLTIMLADPASADDAAIDIQATNSASARFDGRHISWSGQTPAMLGKIKCPTLLVYGDHDPMPYPSYGDRIAIARQAMPDIEAVLVPGAGHWLQYERATETNHLLTNFFGPATVNNSQP